MPWPVPVAVEAVAPGAERGERAEVPADGRQIVDLLVADHGRQRALRLDRHAPCHDLDRLGDAAQPHGDIHGEVLTHSQVEGLTLGAKPDSSESNS